MINSALKGMSVYQATEMVCRELPERWELVLSMENGAASVSLYNPLGESVTNSCDPTENIEDQLIQAVGWAKAHTEDF